MDHHDKLVCGDFNIPAPQTLHQYIDYSNTLFDTLYELNLVCINTQKYTRIGNSHKRNTAPDLTFISTNLITCTEWDTIQDTMGSDHLPIKIHINCATHHNNTHTTRKNLRYINYELYQHYPTDYCNNQKSMNPELRYLLIIQAIKSYLDKFHPFNHTHQTKFKPNNKPIWWTPECSKQIALRRRALATFDKQMTLKNYMLLKQQTASTKRVIKKIKRQSWRNFCTQLPSKSTSKTIWNKIIFFTSRRASSMYGLTPDIPKDKKREYLQSITPDWAVEGPYTPPLYTDNLNLIAPINIQEF